MEGEVSEVDFTALSLLLAKRRKMDFKVVTDSMTPLIAVGAKIQVESLEDEPSRFDILVFWNGRLLICHFLWFTNQITDPCEGPIYITRNLLNEGEDLPIPGKHVLGRVTNFRIPTLTRLGILWSALRRPR